MTDGAAHFEPALVVAVLEEMATVLEVSGANPFRVRAFRRGARALDSWTGDLRAAAEAGELTRIEGIGKGIAAVVSELVRTGKSREHEELRQSIPPGLLDLVRLPGLGPKRIRTLREGLGVEGLDSLEEAARAGRVRELSGFGERTEQELLAALARERSWAGRWRVPRAERIAHRFRERLATAPGVIRVEIAGSLRRRRETVGDVDILVAAEPGDAAREVFLGTPGIAAQEKAGPARCRVVSEEGPAVDLRRVDPDAFAAALLHFTGSAEHNTRLRSLARARGWKLNEYGLTDETGRALPCREEADVYRHLGLAFIPPELREDRGEVERAEGGEEALPLVEAGDLAGTLHVHTTASDGRNTLREMAEAAHARGLRYLGIADHSRSAAYAGGLSVDELRAQGDEVRALDAELDGITLLHGVESDILADGALDYPDDVLAELDFVVASVHSRFSLSREEQTARIERALRHGATSVWGHPTGRLLLRREPYDIDLDRLLEVAAEEGVIVEINANPARLDLDWRWGERVRELGLRVGIHPDAHDTAGLDDLRHGVGIARKAGLVAAAVANTRPVAELRSLLRRLA